jgi:hypothetical protein
MSAALYSSMHLFQWLRLALQQYLSRLKKALLKFKWVAGHAG